MSQTFTCARCGIVFDSDRPDAEAEDEFQSLFRDDPHVKGAREVLCEECWQAFLAWWEQTGR